MADCNNNSSNSNLHCNDVEKIKKHINAYITSIIFDQVSIIQCEHYLFYEVINRIVLELGKCENQTELSSIIDALECFIKASAFKEESIAEVIESCKSLNIAK